MLADRQPVRLILAFCCFTAASDVILADDAPKPTIRKFAPIEVQSYANQALDTDFHGYRGNNLKPLPRGKQKFADVDYQIGDKFIQLAGKRAPDFPEAVRNIKVGRKLQSLQFLQGTGWGSPGVNDGAEIGQYVVHYADETTETIPIQYGRHVRDWWALNEQFDITEGAIAWTGMNDASKDFRGRQVTIRLFKQAWVNPHPESKVDSVDFISKNETICSPFLIAISVELPEDNQAAVDSLKSIGAFVELDETGHVHAVSLSGPGAVSNINRGSDVYLMHLSKLPALEVAYLNSPGFSDSGMEYLSEVESLRWLSLNLANISDAGLKRLKVLDQLERLRLHRTLVTDEGLIHLTELKRLKVLDLSQTKVTDAALPQLSKLTALEELDIRRTSLSDDGFEQLMKLLPNTKILR